jgi:hypothetical protein
LSKLRYADEIELIETVPRVKLLKVSQHRFDFLTFVELSRLVEAMKGDPERLALALLGAEAGAPARRDHCARMGRRGSRGWAKAIQELVGHSTLTVTLRYMHLAPSALTEAIGLLNFGQPVGSAESAAV